MRRAVSILGAGLAAMAMTIAGAGTANAQADGPKLCITGACTWFVAEGEHHFLQDTEPDGHSAAVEVQVPGLGIYTRYWNSAGDGWIQDNNASYAEGYTVYYRPCIGEWNGGDPYTIACSSGWTHGTS